MIKKASEFLIRQVKCRWLGLDDSITYIHQIFASARPSIMYLEMC